MILSSGAGAKAGGGASASGGVCCFCEAVGFSWIVGTSVGGRREWGGGESGGVRSCLHRVGGAGVGNGKTPDIPWELLA